MRYRASSRFDRSVRRLDPVRKARVTDAIDRLVAGFETGQLPIGLGLTQLKPGLWEVRAGLSSRILFHRSGDAIVFLLAGDHDDIKRFLRTV
jgi:hypothetical protein